MPLFSLRNQLWGGMNLEPGDLMPSPSRDHRVLCEGKYAMHAPDGHHIARVPGGKKWIIVPDEASEKRPKKSSESDDITPVLISPDTEVADAPKTKRKGKGRIKRLPGGSRDE